MAAILITGASRGVGLALAQAYAAAGDTVLAAMRNPSDAKDLPDGCEAITLDVADPVSVAAMAEALQGHPIDVLINNAGVQGTKPQTALETNFDGFAEALAINTIGPLRVTQALLPNLRAATNAKIGIVTSRVGALAVGGTGNVGYRASKAAANKMTQCLAFELQPEGIAAVAIHPGWVSTEMGGPEGPVTPEQSAAGIKALLDGLTMAESGRFWSYDGSEMPW